MTDIHREYDQYMLAIEILSDCLWIMGLCFCPNCLNDSTKAGLNTKGVSNPNKIGLPYSQDRPLILSWFGNVF